MKSRSREINIFSVSALDLFASALGAFILISIVLMPYFLRVSQEEVDQLRSALTQAQATLADTQQQLRQAQGELQQCLQREAACRQEVDGLQRQVDQLQGELAHARSALAQAQDSQSALQRCQAELDACEVKLSKTFLAVVIQWETDLHDVDLHIIDPAGNEFQYNQPKHRPHPGELSADTTCGPAWRYGRWHRRPRASIGFSTTFFHAEAIVVTPTALVTRMMQSWRVACTTETATSSSANDD